MLKRIYHLILFNIKYEFKRMRFLIVLLLLLVLTTRTTMIGKDLKTTFTSIDIQDEDNSDLSKELIDFLLIQKNFTTSEQALHKLTIPKGFEDDYKKYNASIIGPIFGVDSNDIYEFQLYKMNETKRIHFSSDVLGGSSGLFIFFMLIILISSFTNTFITSRKDGTLYFISNNINFWVYFMCSRIITVSILIFLLIKNIITFQYLLLLIILFLAFILLIYKLRKNARILDRYSWCIYGVGFSLLFMKLQNLYYLPIVDLLFKEIHPIIIVDIIILIVLFMLVRKIKLTEK